MDYNKIKELRNFGYKFIERWDSNDFSDIMIDIVKYNYGEEGFVIHTISGCDYEEVIDACIDFSLYELNKRMEKLWEVEHI